MIRSPAIPPAVRRCSPAHPLYALHTVAALLLGFLLAPGSAVDDASLPFVQPGDAWAHTGAAPRPAPSGAEPSGAGPSGTAAGSAGGHGPETLDGISQHPRLTRAAGGEQQPLPPAAGPGAPHDPPPGPPLPLGPVTAPYPVLERPMHDGLHPGRAPPPPVRL